MCQSNALIEMKVNEFVGQQKMFTSVDIANAIKCDGKWVRNREVAAWLRSNVASSYGNYTTTTIEVSGGRQATLYHPLNADSSTYDSRDQRALKPNEVDGPSKTVSKNISKSQTTVRNASQTSDDGIILKGKRIRIPASLIKQLGWQPGDSIDSDKIVINGAPLSPNLKVTTESRVSVARKSLNLGDSKVKVFIENGKIHFEAV
jgi:hypothetical protein